MSYLICAGVKVGDTYHWIPVDVREDPEAAASRCRDKFLASHVGAVVRWSGPLPEMGQRMSPARIERMGGERVETIWEGACHS